MPFANHLRVSAIGTLGTPGSERFSYGFSLDSFGDGLFSSLEERCADVAGDLVAFHTSAGASLWSGAVLTEVKIAAIGSDGKYLLDPYIQPVNAPGAVTGFPQHAFQVALCVSLNTARRGSTGRGRFFLPAPMVSVNMDGRIPDNVRDAIEASAQTLLNDVNNAPGIDGNGSRVVVASSRGYNSAVTGVRVGQVLDTIRSRRRSLPETYQEPLTVG